MLEDGSGQTEPRWNGNDGLKNKRRTKPSARSIVISLQPGFQCHSGPSAASCTHQTLLWDGVRAGPAIGTGWGPSRLCQRCSATYSSSVALVTQCPGGHRHCRGLEDSLGEKGLRQRCGSGWQPDVCMERGQQPQGSSVSCGDLGGVGEDPWNLLGEAALEHLGCGQEQEAHQCTE